MLARSPDVAGLRGKDGRGPNVKSSRVDTRDGSSEEHSGGREEHHGGVVMTKGREQKGGPGVEARVGAGVRVEVEVEISITL